MIYIFSLNYNKVAQHRLNLVTFVCNSDMIPIINQRNFYNCDKTLLMDKK